VEPNSCRATSGHSFSTPASVITIAVLIASLGYWFGVADGDPPPGDGPVLGAISARIDSLAPHATGIFLAEVTRLHDSDARAIDGDWVQVVNLRILRSTGATRPALELLRERGWPMLASTSHPKPHFVLKPDTFHVGERFWLAAAPGRIPYLYPVGLVGCWPENSGAAARLCEAAVEQDAYAWHPELWPSGSITGWFDDSLKASSRARVWREGHLLWDVPLGGLLTHSGGDGVNLSDAKNFPSKEWPLPHTDGHLVFAEIRATLDSSSAAPLPAGSWRVQKLLTEREGKVVGELFVTDTTPYRTDRLYRAYDLRGGILFERIRDRFDSGGKQLGGRDDYWVRAIEHRYDPSTGRLVSERFFRNKWPGETGESWVEMDRPTALAFGPPGSSWR